MMQTIDEKLTYNQISFHYARKSAIDEREIHPYHEILYYMDGDATFLCEQFQEKLQKGALLLIPKECYHCFQPREPEQFTRLKISFPDMPSLGDLPNEAMTGIRILRREDNPMIPMLDRMCRLLMESDKDERVQLFLYGAFLMLLAELSVGKEQTSIQAYHETSPLISGCLKYIDENLMKDVSVEAIADRLHISPSTLSHTFKKELGISMHQYVMQRRLIYARKLITAKGNPTKVYLECGYSDYSSFYKAYVKMFGVPPSNDRG